VIDWRIDDAFHSQPEKGAGEKNKDTSCERGRERGSGGGNSERWKGKLKKIPAKKQPLGRGRGDTFKNSLVRSETGAKGQSKAPKSRKELKVLLHREERGGDPCQAREHTQRDIHFGLREESGGKGDQSGRGVKGGGGPGTEDPAKREKVAFLSGRREKKEGEGGLAESRHNRHEAETTGAQSTISSMKRRTEKFQKGKQGAETPERREPLADVQCRTPMTARNNYQGGSAQKEVKKHHTALLMYHFASTTEIERKTT